jgi:NADH:ubiquinone oxidoreductase subunit E
MEIQVCIGSVCHLKGSYEIINKLDELINSNGLDDKIQIKAAFCLGQCVGAVCVKVKDTIYSVQPDTVTDFFENVVKKQVM